MKELWLTVNAILLVVRNLVLFGTSIVVVAAIVIAVGQTVERFVPITDNPFHAEIYAGPIGIVAIAGIFYSAYGLYQLVASARASLVENAKLTMNPKYEQYSVVCKDGYTFEP